MSLQTDEYSFHAYNWKCIRQEWQTHKYALISPLLLLVFFFGCCCDKDLDFEFDIDSLKIVDHPCWHQFLSPMRVFNVREEQITSTIKLTFYDTKMQADKYYYNLSHYYERARDISHYLIFVLNIHSKLNCSMALSNTDINTKYNK